MQKTEEVESSLSADLDTASSIKKAKTTSKNAVASFLQTTEESETMLDVVYRNRFYIIGWCEAVLLCPPLCPAFRPALSI